MKDRIKKIRNMTGKSQTDFAKAISVTRSAVCKMESGENSPSDQTINIICREFSINENWLRYGEEPMKISHNAKLASYLAEIPYGNDEFIKDLIEVYMDLDQTSKDALKLIADRMLEKRNNKK